MGNPILSIMRSAFLVFLTVLAAAPLCDAGVLDDLERAVATLRHPRVEDGHQGPAAGLVLPLAAGSLDWERGACRVLPMVVEGDSLWVVELTGRGLLRLSFDDPVEQIALRAAAGRKAGTWKLRRALLVLDEIPAAWPDPSRWQPLARRWPRRPPRPVEHNGRLDQPGPDHPLLDRASSCWLWTEPDGLLWREGPGRGWLFRPLHDGSSLDVPVARLSGDSGPPDWGCALDSLQLRLDGSPLALRWEVALDLGAPTSTWTALQLSATASLDSAAWADGRPARVTRRLGGSQPGPWLLVETPAAGRLRLSGSSPRGLAVDERAGTRRAARSAWFPVPGAGQAPVPFRLEDPAGVLPAWQVTDLRQRADGRAASRLFPEERVATPLGAGARLCWTPLRHQSGRHLPEAARPPRHVPLLEDLELPRERDARPPSRDSALEPLDLAQGADTLSQGILQEEEVLTSLAAAALRLEGWLGEPARPVTLLERQGPEPTRRDEIDQLLRWELPPEEPLEIGARALRSGAPEDRLRRLEMLCRGWWLPVAWADEAAPRWIRHGAARACALRLLEEEDPAAARRLREEALERQGSVFRPHASASLPMLGERAEGGWRSADTQDGLAWRFALLLEHLRGRLRDPAGLDDGSWLRLMAGLAPRLREPLKPGKPLEDLRQALADGLVAEGVLETAGFRDVRELWSWLDNQWTRSSLPGLQVVTGRVETEEGPRLALHATWTEDPHPGTAIPVLLRLPEGMRLFTLRAELREERYLLPLDPAEVEGLEVAPGASLPARVTIR
jgi:hypothetical protein